MILQCDQCNTKFRLDDSKLKPGGVKVRCSKCRHVFLAGAEQKHEESEFDAILSGLGAPALAKTPEAAPSAAQQPSGAELAALELGPEPSQPQQEPAPAADLDFGGFGFAPEEPGEPQPESAGIDFEPEGLQEPALETGFDLGEINFETGTVAGSEPEQTAGGELGDFEFNEEPVAPAEVPAGGNLDFGEFSFDEETTIPKEEQAAPAAADTLDFGEFSFDEETSIATEEKQAPVAADALDFGEFSFDQESSATKEEITAPAAAEALDFGEFSFEEESLTPELEKPASAAAATLDFGELSFEEGSTATEEKPASAAAATLDFGEFSFEEESSTPKEEQAAPAAAVARDLGEFSFEEEPPRTEEGPLADVSDDFASFSLSGKDQMKEMPTVSEPDEEFSFGEFSFPEEPEPEPVPKKETVPFPAEVTAGAAAAAGLSGRAETGRPEAAAAPVTPTAGIRQKGPQSSLDFTFGDKPFATPVPEEVPEEELPPLSIVSRRKGRSALTISIVAISVMVVLALSAAGVYLLQSGPAALEKLDKMGIGFVAQWFGMQSPEEGRITIRNPLAAFHQNQQAGELFVVTGEAVNSFRKARASVQVRVSLFDKSGKVLLQKTAYCGNRLSNEQLSTLPMEKIESIMNNQFGDSLSNLGVKPGQPIGFVVAIANVPKEAADFGVEVVGSTVAAGQ